MRRDFQPAVMTSIAAIAQWDAQWWCQSWTVKFSTFSHSGMWAAEARFLKGAGVASSPWGGPSRARWVGRGKDWICGPCDGRTERGL